MIVMIFQNIKKGGIMKKSILVLSFIFILIGCGGGNGTSNNKSAKITQSNVDDIVAAYYDSVDLDSGIGLVTGVILSTYNNSSGTHNCSNGGDYEVSKSGGTIRYKFNNCKDNNKEMNGVIVSKNNNKDIEVENFVLKDNQTTLNYNGHIKAQSNSHQTINIDRALWDKKGVYKIETKNSVYNINKSGNTKNTDISSLANSSKIDGWIKIDTTKAIKKVSGDICPKDGRIRVRGESNYIDIQYNSDFSVDIYFNGDSSVITSYNSCNDIPHYIN